MGLQKFLGKQGPDYLWGAHDMFFFPDDLLPFLWRTYTETNTHTHTNTRQWSQYLARQIVCGYLRCQAPGSADSGCYCPFLLLPSFPLSTHNSSSLPVRSQFHTTVSQCSIVCSILLLVLKASDFRQMLTTACHVAQTTISTLFKWFCYHAVFQLSCSGLLGNRDEISIHEQPCLSLLVCSLLCSHHKFGSWKSSNVQSFRYFLFCECFCACESVCTRWTHMWLYGYLYLSN